MKKHIVIAGGNGFLGRELEEYFQNQQYKIIVLSRHPKTQNDKYWNAKDLGEWTQYLENAWAIINLTGKSVNCRYTIENKNEILLSRIQSTKIIGEAIQQCKNPPEYWFNASSATIYDDIRGTRQANTESSSITQMNFSVNIVQAWENEFHKHITPHTKKVILRASIVWGKKGGAFPTLVELAKKGVNTKQGTGSQWVSWIHIDDFCNIIFFIMNNEKEGIFNLACPEPVTNESFYKSLKKELKLKWGFPQPIWAIKLGAILLGTETELVLKSRKVISEKLIKLGYHFRFRNAEIAIKSLL
ncbi:MAG: TIGR01777 family protein [Cytophagales bacterium]|nr:TIGR01777 family protein [Cytophagales bacterium]